MSLISNSWQYVYTLLPVAGGVHMLMPAGSHGLIYTLCSWWGHAARLISVLTVECDIDKYMIYI